MIRCCGVSNATLLGRTRQTPEALEHEYNVFAKLRCVECVEEEVEREVDMIEETRHAFHYFFSYVGIQVMNEAVASTSTSSASFFVVLAEEGRYKIVDFTNSHRTVQYKESGRYDEQRSVRIRIGGSLCNLKKRDNLHKLFFVMPCQ